VHLEGTETLKQDMAGESFGALLRELGGEGENHGGVDAGGCEEIESLGEGGGDEARSGAGTKEMAGVRLEGDGDGTGLKCAGALDYARQQEAVAEMQAVVVADAEDGAVEVRGKFGGIVEDLHGGLRQEHRRFDREMSAASVEIYSQAQRL
jgi:hypothetical protein